MCKSIIKGAIIGGIIVFVWGFVSWMYLPWHTNMFKHFTNEEFVSAAVKENMTKDGMYMIPSLPKNLENDEAYSRQEQLMQKGPFIFGTFVKDGVSPMSWRNLLGSFIGHVVAAGFLSYLLAASKMRCYWGKVWSCVCIAFFAGVVTYFPLYNWLHFPLNYTIVNCLDLIIGWGLAGLALAGIIKGCGCPHSNEQQSN